MPILTAALAAGGLVLLPVEINSAINGIQAIGPRRLDISYAGYLPLPIIGTRIKAANANISAWIGPSTYNIASRAEAAGIVGWFVDYNLTISATALSARTASDPPTMTASTRTEKRTGTCWSISGRTTW
jgi:hypothetical protein